MASYDKNIKINLDYSSFSGGISQCQAKMKTLNAAMKLSTATLDENSDSSKALAEKEELLTAKIQLQQKIVEQTIVKYRELTEDSDATTAAVERMEQAVLKQETALAQMQSELAGVVAEEQNVVETTAETSEAFDEAGTNTESFSSKVSNAVSTISAFSAAIEAVGSELGGLASDTAQLGDDLLTQSQITGLTTDELQELAYAAHFVDVETTTITGSQAKMIRVMGEAQAGSEAAAEKFQNLGVKIADSSGHLRGTQEVFDEVIDALGGMSNETERDAIAMEIFGRSAQQLNPLIEAGSERLDELRKEAHETGNVFGKDAVEGFGATQDILDTMNIEMETASIALGEALSPAVELVAQGFSDLPQPVQMSIVAFKSIMSIASAFVPIMTMVNTQTIASAVANGTLTAAEYTKVGADTAATASTWALNAALLAQVGLVALIAAGIIALIYVIYQLAQAYDSEANSANNASDASSKFAAANASVGQNSISRSASSNSIHRALGGKIYPHAAAGYESVWVGEQGAELVDLPVGSTVYNHEDSRNMASTTNYFNVTIDAQSVDEMSKVVRVFNGLSQSLNRGGRLNR